MSDYIVIKRDEFDKYGMESTEDVVCYPVNDNLCCSYETDGKLAVDEVYVNKATYIVDLEKFLYAMCAVAKRMYVRIYNLNSIKIARYYINNAHVTCLRADISHYQTIADTVNKRFETGKN
jgi:hypothetical protein